jgi:hypothetical protein
MRCSSTVRLQTSFNEPSSISCSARYGHAMVRVSSRFFTHESSSLITCKQGHDGLRGCPKTKLNSSAAHSFVVASSPQPSEHASMVSQPLQLCLWSLRLCFESVSLKIAIYGVLVFPCQSPSTHSQGIRRRFCLKLCRECQIVLL